MAHLPAETAAASAGRFRTARNPFRSKSWVNHVVHNGQVGLRTGSATWRLFIDTTTLDALRRHGEVIGQGEREHCRIRWQDGPRVGVLPGLGRPRGDGGLSGRSVPLPGVTRDPGAVRSPNHDTDVSP